jgi:hypothetical protein
MVKIHFNPRIKKPSSNSSYIVIGAWKSTSMVGRIIKYFQHHPYTHVFYVMNPPKIFTEYTKFTIIDAMPNSFPFGSVSKRKFSITDDKNLVDMILCWLYIDPKTKNKLHSFLRAQLNKRYNFGDLINTVRSINKKELQKHKEWFCCELLTAAFLYIGLDFWGNISNVSEVSKLNVKKFILPILVRSYKTVVITNPYYRR